MQYVPCEKHQQHAQQTRDCMFVAYSTAVCLLAGVLARHAATAGPRMQREDSMPPKWF